MNKEIKLKSFEGPLDLLLQLIEGEKLAITEIAIAEVTDQFFAHLDTLGEDRSEELADFLVIATKLVYLKSRHLLPYLYPAEEEGTSLTDQLKFYKRYADASRDVEKQWNQNLMAYSRFEPAPAPEGFTAPLNASANDLHTAFTMLLKRIRPINPLPTVTIDRTVSVQQKIKSLFNALSELKKISFKEMINKAENRSEVIVTFLAVLELVKQEKASIQQQNAFEDMIIQKV